MGARAGLSLTFFQIGETEIHIGHQNPKNRVIFAQKTKNHMLKKGKTGNHNGQKNRKPNFFAAKTKKTDLKNGQNRKSQRPPREGRAFLTFFPRKGGAYGLN